MKAYHLFFCYLYLSGVSLLLNVGNAIETTCNSNDIKWLWMGALTSSSLNIKFALEPSSGCLDKIFTLLVFPTLKTTEKPHSIVVNCTPIRTNAMIQQCQIEHLPYSNRIYSYTLKEGSQILKEGSFHTPKVEGEVYNFRIAFSSCADEDSNPAVFQAISAYDPLFFLHMGDLHYHDLIVNDVEAFRNAYHSLFASLSGQALLEMNKPIVYMWDDHDYGPDNSDRTAPGREAALRTYLEMVPHYPILHNVDAGIYQAFTIGRVRFIITDLRSNRTPNDAPTVPSKTVLGPLQKKWFKEELLHATTSNNIQMIIWCSTMPWNDDERKWGHFPHEQKELVNYIRGHGLNTKKKIVIVSGDAHMLAIDDGSHSPGNLTVFHAAALGRPGSVKGGPYSHGAIPGSGQFGILDVKDNGTTVCLHFQGLRMNDKKDTVSSDLLMEYSTCHPETTPSKQIYTPPPLALRKWLRLWKKARKSSIFWGSLAIVISISIGLTWYCLLAKKKKKKTT